MSNYEDIVRCHSDINYTTIYKKDKQKIVVAKTLKEFEELLSVCKKTSKSFTDKGLEYYPLLNNVYTSNRISRLFWFGRGEAGIQKMRSLFFERSKSSGVPVTQPAGCGGESNELKEPTCLKAKSKMNKDSKRKFL